MLRHKTFETVEDMPDIIKENILICIVNVAIIYNKRGFKIESILVDP